MIIAVYNPATRNINHTVLAVPHANFTMKVYNETSFQFENTLATVLCNYELNGDLNFQLYAKYVIHSHQIGFLQLTYNASANISTPKLTNGSFKIENDVQWLQYKGQAEDLEAQGLRHGVPVAQFFDPKEELPGKLLLRI